MKPVKKMRFRESFLGIFIIAIILSILLPLPTVVLDFLFTLNIGLSLIILLSALYSKEPLDMSLFPTILLITTLFRIALNISSTRSMLTRGDAGKVVDTFGAFVASGNMVVGGVIFVIIVIVNFMVITAGSGRVAEVTARFTLDAMPGKQMAIDADLNAGLIDDVEAKARRKKISDEANFYGSMDGASKFVKGDAISGILITLINIIGGVIVGVTMLGMDFNTAINKFMILTVGDGLVGQIPALLISTATGILVTKATSESEITFTVVNQLFSQPKVLYISALSLVVLGIFTPLPELIFIPLGLLLAFGAYTMDKKQVIDSIQTEITADEEEVDKIRRLDNVTTLLNVDAITLRFGYGLIPLIETSQGGDIIDRVVMIRRQVALEFGAIVPEIHLKDDIRLNPNEYKIYIKGVEVAGGDIMFGHYLAMNPGYVEEEIDGIETSEPYLGVPALWITENQRERAEALGYTVVDPSAIIMSHLTEIINEYLHELLTRQDVQELIDNIKERNSVLIEELIPRTLSIGEIQKVLANLLREGISIRDLVTVLESLADKAASTRDTDLLTEFVRESLRRSISRKYLNNAVNTVISLDPSLEDAIRNSIKHTEQGTYLAMDPKTTHKIFDNVREETSKLTSMGLQPIIIASPIIRLYFKHLIEPIMPDVVVLSHSEIEQSCAIQYIGMVTV